jgi:hypothetical protein
MGVVDAAVAGHKKILQKPQQIRVSSPSTHQNRLNQQKTNEKKPSRKWHSSYVPRHIIKTVENKQTRPIAGPSHLTSRSASTLYLEAASNEAFTSSTRQRLIFARNSNILAILAVTPMQGLSWRYRLPPFY